jgi:hypothetical protein
MDTQTRSPAVELNPAHVEVEPGGQPAEAVVAIKNQSDIIQQYTIELTGLDIAWYTLPVTSTALFPGDRDEFRIRLHPPGQPGVGVGTRQFRVVVVARSQAGEWLTEGEARGELQVRGVASFRLVDIVPRTAVGRGRGTYHLQIENNGTAEVRLQLEGHDDEEACTFRFPDHAQPLVAANTTSRTQLVVTPKKRPWVGPQRTYNFTIYARPRDARGGAQTKSAAFTHKPRFQTLSIWPVLRLTLIALATAGVLVALFRSGIPVQFKQRLDRAVTDACGELRDTPVLGAMCPGTACEFLPNSGFEAVYNAQPDLIGSCTTDEMHDNQFGNGLQYTDNGVLYWVQGSNTVYFFTGHSLYVFQDGEPRLLDGPGQ